MYSVKQPTISVVMAVFNGRQYISKQINSIKAQTLQVNELVIIDDCSSEKCNDIINDCINDVTFHVTFIEHEKNMGYAQTFFEALKIATGEFVFFADQDDIWEPNKVEECINVLMQNPQISCLSSCNILIDSNDNEIRKEKRPRKRLIRITEKKLIKQTALRPGMTLAIKRIIQKKINTIDTSQYEAHDRLVEYISTLDNGFYLFGVYLNRYRIHDKNTSGMNMSHFTLRTGIQGRISQIDKEIRYLKLLESLGDSHKKIISRYIYYFQTRKILLIKHNLLKYIIGSVRIAYGYSSKKIWLGDLLCIIKGE